MADTIRVGDYAIDPEIVCTDCHEKGQVVIHYWGLLAPSGTPIHCCAPCWRKREEYYMLHGKPMPVPDHSSLAITIARAKRVCQHCTLPIAHDLEPFLETVTGVVIDGFVDDDEIGFGHATCIAKSKGDYDFIGVIYEVKDIKALINNLPDTMKVILVVDNSRKRTNPTFAVENGTLEIRK